ncbi:Nitrate/nitrite transporter NarK [Prauserella marina]|uniref:Nitrate/nitrite transporter NarK n=1 Tax=Prauserella marina TaxID=530584 RepID=A0A1G6YQ51_9PSEU|nr:MFS transporter [Prauserella marina]PWV71981.1 nitrate/nitrite transporter NarK [Prauserella marina]SDD92440.1 Nitrate/nitrite transporter NarK [Prauserella marina]
MRGGTWLPWVMWGLGALCYLSALFHRMSLSVAGLTAQDRFGIDATGLAAFSVVQLALYAALQVPVGIGADRFGPRRLLLTGMISMTAGTILFALAGGFPAAMAGRALIGAGDACMFVSTLRIVHNWFAGHRYAFVAALTGMIGGLGQLIATAPLSALLEARGWTGSFLIAAAVTVFVLVVTAIALKEAPSGVESRVTAVERPVTGLRQAWRTPGTRHAMWTHFTLMGTFVSFTAVLGQPYLVTAHARTPAAAGSLLAVVVLGFVLVSTAGGRLASRRPSVRAPLVLGAAVVTTACGALLVAVPGPAPTWLLAAALFLIGACGGVSMLAFDLARSSNAVHRAGIATGVANMGGFGFAVVAQLGTGVLLDTLSGSGMAPPSAHRAAFAVPLALAAGGLLAMIRSHRYAGSPVPGGTGEQPVLQNSAG